MTRRTLQGIAPAIKMSTEKRIMPANSEKRTNRGKTEKASSQTSRKFIWDPGDSKHGENSNLGEAHDKMGFMFSKIAKHISPKPFAAHYSTGVKAATDSHDDRIAPEPGEIPPNPGSAPGLKRATTNEVRNEFNFLWPYVSIPAPQHGLVSEHPLKLRRPALYEEYWAHEPRSVAGQIRHKQQRE